MHSDTPTVRAIDEFSIEILNPSEIAAFCEKQCMIFSVEKHVLYCEGVCLSER